MEGYTSPSWASTTIPTNSTCTEGRTAALSDGHYNCGPAGEYMDIRYNTFLYVAGHAFKLRGTPAIRADVANNSFRHDSLWGSVIIGPEPDRRRPRPEA